MKNLLVLIAFLVSSAMAADNVKALQLALDDEYKAEATYMQVIDDFGDRRPFSNIINSERRHIQALLPFFQKYNVEVPSNPYVGKIPSQDSLKQACLVGVEAEVENVELYDRLFALADDPELINVFKNLQWASQERHLRAFQRCASR